MEGDTFMLLFLTLFFGVFAMKSLSIPKGTGIVVRTGGMLGLGSRVSASFLWVVLIVIVLLIIINCSCDARSFTTEGSTVAVIMFLALFFTIFAMNSMFSAPAVSTRKPAHTPGARNGFLSAPLFWVVVIVVVLVINGGR